MLAPVMKIVTERLELIPATAGMLRDDDAGVPYAGGWPPELFDAGAVKWTLQRLDAGGDPAWYTYYFVRRHDPLVIGVGGYTGPPVNGEVEIGYGVMPEHQRRGYATEATRGLVSRAFEHDEVERVIAHTLPGLVPSIGVLEKCGFRFTGGGAEPGTIRYEIART